MQNPTVLRCPNLTDCIGLHEDFTMQSAWLGDMHVVFLAVKLVFQDIGFRGHIPALWKYHG